ncbi:MAG: short-chain dehydrogenase, partial [Candidatus Delongbacteria bacterium]
YVLITGAGSGLGKQLAIQFAKKNYSVALVGRDGSKLENVSNEYGFENSICISADVSNYADVEKIFEIANNWGGSPYIVINCAGEGVFGEIGSFSAKQINDVLSANLIGTIQVSQKAYSLMKGNKGFIVNVMSTAAKVGRKMESIYCAAKWGANGFTESMKIEAKGTPLRVMSVFPGGMNTGFWSEKCGLNPDTSKFMNPSKVANTIIKNILEEDGIYVADLLINRI